MIVHQQQFGFLLFECHEAYLRCQEQIIVTPPSALFWIASDAPMIPARYCIIRSPMPRGSGSTSGRPLPQSSICRITISLFSTRVTCTFFDLPCLTELEMPSCATR